MLCEVCFGVATRTVALPASTYWKMSEHTVNVCDLCDPEEARPRIEHSKYTVENREKAMNRRKTQEGNWNGGMDDGQRALEDQFR